MRGRTSGINRELVRVFRDGTLSGLSDGEVLGRFVADRDEAAFEVLLSRHGSMVLNVCRQILRDRDDVEDAFQATFLALACKAASLRIGDSLGPWLYRVATRVAARARADRRRRGDREHSGGAIPEPEPASDVGSDPDRVETTRVVHEELGRLPERLRAPIVLCYLEGMTHEEAARRLGCPVGTVRSRMARGRALLHGRIARRGIVTPAAVLGAVLASEVGASAVSWNFPVSLARTAVRIAVGTASLHRDCGVPARVAALLEGVLSMLRIKQIVGAVAAVAVVGAVVTIAGLSGFAASGQAGNDAGSPRPIGTDARPDDHPPLDTYVKTYYVGDIIGSESLSRLRRRQAAKLVPAVGSKDVEMEPLIELITSTVASGTWTIHDGRTGRPVTIVDGRLVEPEGRVVRTKGTITPFYLSISLIVRHTAEVHDEVANLLRGLRKVLDSRDHPAGSEGPDRERGPAEGAAKGESKREEPAPIPTDRNARIRRLVEELSKEVEGLTRDPR